jgi:CO/xanthine dehydrogenase Mo-binding subunit
MAKARRTERARTRTVGRSVERVDGAAKAAGAAAYPQDLALPEGCLHVATVRAPVARARLRRIDGKPALAVPGVMRVLTAADVRGATVGDRGRSAGAGRRGDSRLSDVVAPSSPRASRQPRGREGQPTSSRRAVTDAESGAPGAPLVHAERTPVGDI